MADAFPKISAIEFETRRFGENIQELLRLIKHEKDDRFREELNRQLQKLLSAIKKLGNQLAQILSRLAGKLSTLFAPQIWPTAQSIKNA